LHQGKVVIHNPMVGIFKLSFSGSSEPFVTEQARNLARYSPFFIIGQLTGPFAFPNIALSRNGRSRFRKDWFYLTRSGRGFRRFPEIRSVRLMHAHFGIDGVYALGIAQDLGIPLITTFHGYDITTNLSEFLRTRGIVDKHYYFGLKRLRRGGDRFIAVSRFIEKRLIEEGFPRNRVFQHYIGVDVNRFVPGRKNTEKRYILCVGRHAEKKGIETLLEAFALIHGKHKGVGLIQVGTGPLTRELISLAKRLRIDRETEFLGAQPPGRVIELMRSAEIFCLPSRTARNGDSEALGIVFNEASACGLPIVSTNHGGIPEAVIDGETGFLVPEGDHRSLAEKLDLLLSDRGLRETMGARGRELVCDSFDIRKQTAKLESFYDEVATP
jgi:colanic acid/amylovoran biosynthesis glycosyltransferase